MKERKKVKYVLFYIAYVAVTFLKYSLDGKVAKEKIKHQRCAPKAFFGMFAALHIFMMTKSEYEFIHISMFARVVTFVVNWALSL